MAHGKLEKGLTFTVAVLSRQPHLQQYFCCAVVAFVAQKRSFKRKGQTAVPSNSCRSMLLLRNE